MSLPQGLRALRHRDFRLFFAGQGVSQIGTWLQLIATSWLVYRLSDSAFMPGLAAFAMQIPFLVLAPIAGVFVDRLDRRRVLMVTNSIAALQASGAEQWLAWLHSRGVPRPWLPPREYTMRYLEAEGAESETTAEIDNLLVSAATPYAGDDQWQRRECRACRIRSSR